LQRFCVKQYYDVEEGVSKLFSYFLKNKICKQVISYNSCDYSTEDLYLTLGFKLDQILKPRYSWLINGKRAFNFKYVENLERIRCFDSGNLKFVFDTKVNES